MRKMIRKWAPLGIVVILVVAAYMAGLHRALSLQELQERRDDILVFAQAHPVSAPVLFMMVYTGAVALSLPVASLLTLLGGFLFGKVWGTLYVVAGATAGATIIFQIARRSVGASLREKAGGLYRRIEKNMRENAIGYMLFMRLVPIFPFFLVNIVPALFNVSTRTYVLTTFFGIIPAVFVFANLGRELGTLQSLKGLVSAETLIAFALLGLLALLPTLYRHVKRPKAGLPEEEKN